MSASSIVRAPEPRNPGSMSMAGPPPGSPLRRLFDAPVRPGVVRWIGLRPARHAQVRSVMLATLAPEWGIAGDHYRGSSGARQVSLIGCENLAAIGSFLGIEASPEQLRRNIVVGGINLLALKGCRFRLGAALLEYAGDCHPCSRMEEILGAGGYNAVRGQGGILARVLEAGPVALGDPITRVATGPT